MDAISYSYADKQAKRIKKFINDPDSTSGIVTVPKVIASGENITIPSGRVAVLPNVQIDGTLNVQGDVFIPSGVTLSGVVELDGDQTISDVKTFIKSPIVPTPTTGTQAVNKDYADLKVALASFVGTNQSLSGSGYQKLPGGLILQWGSNAIGDVSGTNQNGTVVMPITFPNSNLKVLLSCSDSGGGVWNVFLRSKSNASFNFFATEWAGVAQQGSVEWLAIGY